MANRLTRITTRTGDDGSTGLADGQRLSKHSARIACIGDIDELNSLVGILIAQNPPEDISDILSRIQHRLFDLGGEMAIPQQVSITEKHVRQLEEWLENYNSQLPPLKDFVLPGGNPLAAHCHHARTVCRRAERSLVQISQEESINPLSLQYVNRLSDLIFVLARVLARQNDGQEIIWKKDID